MRAHSPLIARGLLRFLLKSTALLPFMADPAPGLRAMIFYVLVFFTIRPFSLPLLSAVPDESRARLNIDAFRVFCREITASGVRGELSPS